MTTKSPAETLGQQAEAIANQGKEGTWKDTAATLAAVDLAFASLYFGDIYRHMRNARNAQNARQRVNRINRNPPSRSRRGEL